MEGSTLPFYEVKVLDVVEWNDGPGECDVFLRFEDLVAPFVVWIPYAKEQYPDELRPGSHIRVALNFTAWEADISTTAESIHYEFTLDLHGWNEFPVVPRSLFILHGRVIEMVGTRMVLDCGRIVEVSYRDNRHFHLKVGDLVRVEGKLHIQIQGKS